MKKLILTITIMLVALPLAQAWAAPSISGANGTFADGQQVTISGSGFGATGPNVLFFDDFEKGTVGQPLSTVTGSARIGQWSTLGAVPPIYSNADAVSGTKEFYVTDNPSQEGHTNGIIALPSSTNTFWSFWTKVPSTSLWSGEGTPGGINWKLSWIANSWSPITDDNIDVGFGSTLAHDINYYVVESDDSRIPYGTNTPNPFTMVKGQWQHFSYWMKDGSASNGTVGVWEISPSGGYQQLVYNTGVTNSLAGVTRQLLSINAYTRQPTAGTYPVQQFDDVYVATGPGAAARVAIGDSATYTACHNITILTPTAWSNGQITATVRQGSFKSGQTAYVFVFDANNTGNTNSGYKVTIGGASSAPPQTSTPPSPPANVHIVGQ